MSTKTQEDINVPTPVGEQLQEIKEEEPIISLTESQLNSIIKEAIDNNHEEKVRSLFRDCAMSMNSLEEKILDLNEIIDKQNLVLRTIGHNPSQVVDISQSGSKNINELRAKQIFPELQKQKQLSPGDIIRMCKLGKRGHETAHRVMDMAEKLFPEECRHDMSTISGKAKHWLVHKDHIGFRK